jgi:hypothetical protein
MNLADLANFIAGKIRLTDLATLAKLKGFAGQRYAQMHAGALWKDALGIYTFAVAAGQHTVILPAGIAQFVAAKFDRTGLVPVDQAFLFNSSPGLWEEAGTPSHCSELAAIATRVMPSAAGEQIRVSSSDAGDAGSLVTLHGEDASGEPKTEQITLNGTPPVFSLGSYAVIYGFSKRATVGTITMTSGASSTVYQTLLPAETQRLHRRVRLHAAPTVPLTLLVLGKRHPGPFTQDADATALPPLCDQALQALVHGDALEWMSQHGKAQAKFAEGLALEMAAKKAETYQAVQSRRIVPAEAMAEGCTGDDFL